MHRSASSSGWRHAGPSTGRCGSRRRGEQASGGEPGRGHRASRLQTCIDRKYLVPIDRLAELIARLTDTWAALEIGTRPSRPASHISSRTTIASPRTRKRSSPTSSARPTGSRAAVAAGGDHDLPAYDPGRPSRSHALTCAVDLIFAGADGVAHGPSVQVLVETKSPGLDGAADRALRDIRLRPMQISKYFAAVALLHPRIRAKPWHRILPHDFGASSDRTWVSEARSLEALVYAK